MTDDELPSEYDATEVEPRWQNYWTENEVFRFRLDTDKPPYVVDTPPPFTSGSLHMGHVLNHTWIDIAARYRRMRGYNVLLPQGFDCHGLPTELRVEKQVSKDDAVAFRRACVSWTEDCIADMRSQFDRLGYSADWSRTYLTMSDDYVAKVQDSLLTYQERGMIYRAVFPVHYCTNCGTALAKAELGYEELPGEMVEFRMSIAGEPDNGVVIATTRVELLPACVAVMVHPEDERFNHLAGRKAVLPLLGREVPVIADEAVDTEFGTGVVYNCTFGDEQDLAWQRKYGLPVIEVIDADGRLTGAAGKYAGMTSDEARIEITRDLKAEGALVSSKPYTHRVMVHTERSDCRQPVELLLRAQWFIRLGDGPQRVMAEAEKIGWYPGFMERRLRDWAESLDWDWVISRQRVFGTPIPFWYCRDCGEIIAPARDSLPVDPPRTPPPVKACPKCGSSKLTGTEDVCDCWVDSSISALVAAGWKTDEFEHIYPCAMRPQGYEIIRTWLFYTLLRCTELTGRAPWHDVMVNGMVQGPDGRKMSKSFGNVIAPDEVFEQYGADPLRIWAAMGTLGEDCPFEWKEVVAGQRFLNKLWNMVRFAASHTPQRDVTSDNPVDMWLLSRLQRLLGEVTSEFDSYRWRVVERIRTFAWHDLADNYVELVKYRLYGNETGARDAARSTLHLALRTLLLMLSPVVPHFAEEANRVLGGKESICMAEWPEMGFDADAGAESAGEAVVEITGAIRRFKADNGIALNAPLAAIEVYTSMEGMDAAVDDIRGTTWAERVEVRRKDELSLRQKPIAVEPVMGVLGPAFRGRAGDVAAALKVFDPERLASARETGKPVTVEVGEEKVEVPPSAFEVRFALESGGRAVDALYLDAGTVLVKR